MSGDYNRYVTVLAFIQYRGLVADHKELDEQEVLRTMHADQMIEIRARGLKPTVIYLLKHDNSAVTRIGTFRPILAKSGSKPQHVIIFSQFGTRPSSKNTIAEFSNLTVDVYPHRIVNFDVTKSVFTAKHRILTKAERERVLADLHASAVNLPQIRQLDPQCIWLGVQPGDIVEIEALSATAGKSLHWLNVVERQGENQDEEPV